MNIGIVATRHSRTQKTLSATKSLRKSIIMELHTLVTSILTPTLVTSILTAIVGVVGGFFGAITYIRNQILKRQEIIIPLMEEFDENKKIYYAKELIDRVSIQLKCDNDVIESIPFVLKHVDKDTILTYEHFHLNLFLVGYHYVAEGKEEAEQEGPRYSKLSQDEIIIRTMFDSLLNFFGKLGYLVDIGVITNKELGYFLYYIEKARDDPAVRCFAKNLNYELFAVLLDRIRINHPDLESLAEGYTKRTRNELEYALFKLRTKVKFVSP
jgi:hypothetical protein